MISAHIRSFFDPDRINPIIVKEVRQGNRSKAFLLNFLLAQVAMVLLVVLMSDQASQGGVRSLQQMNQMFWMLFGMVLIVGIPLSGINAINQERAEGRLDLLHLTRLSALKIVRGKCLALVSQSLLITTSLLPYLLVRYYFGSVNVLEDLMIIAIMLVVSALMTGLSVSVSALPSALFRWLIIGGSFWAVIVIGGELIEDYFRSGLRGGGFRFFGMGSFDFIWLAGVLLGQGVLVLIMAMEFGASAICPLAENHQTRIRLLFIAQMLFTVGVLLFAEEILGGMCLVITSGAGIFVMISALIQAPVALPSIYAPFVRWGRFGKSLGFFLLYPGYPSGFYFLVVSVFSMAGCFFLMIDESVPVWAYLGLIIPSVLGCFLLPLTLALLMPGSRLKLLSRYIIVTGILIVLGILGAALSYNYGMFLSYLFVLDPFANLFMMFGNNSFSYNIYVYAIGSSITTGFSIYFIFKEGVHWRRRERELEKVAEQIELSVIVKQR